MGSVDVLVSFSYIPSFSLSILTEQRLFITLHSFQITVI